MTLAASRGQQLPRSLGRIANTLETLGLRDRCLGVLGRNNADTVLVYAAAIIAGVDVVLLNVHLSPREVAYLLEDSGADAVWTSPDLIQTATEAVGVTMPVLASGEDSMWARSIEASAPVLPPLDGRAGRESSCTHREPLDSRRPSSCEHPSTSRCP